MANIDKRLGDVEKKLDTISSTPYPVSGNQVPLPGDEIDLRELWSVIWCGKKIIISTTFVFAVISASYALLLSDIYKSEALLAPAEENSDGGLAGLAGQFGGLASLAGVNLGSGSSADKTALAIEVLKSRAFISKFIQEHELLVPLMAVKDWNRAQNELIIDTDIFEEDTGTWIRKPKPPRGVKPSLQEAHEVFSELFSVSQDKKSNFVTISIQYYSPFLAKQWVDWLVADINDEIKSRDVEEAEKSIEYLSDQLTKTPIAEMQSIFYELIEEQSKTIMFAEVRDEYVFKTIDEAVVPELKFKPKKALICAFGVILGVMLAVFFVLVRHFIKRS